MKKNRLLVVFAALLNVLGMWADGANLKLHFNFENATGGNVKEVISGGNIVGTLMNNAKVETMGKYHVLNLGRKMDILTWAKVQEKYWLDAATSPSVCIIT